MKKYYKKTYPPKVIDPNIKKGIRYGGILCTIIGSCILIYFSAPVLFWKVLFASVFASVNSPVPHSFMLTPEMIEAIKKEQARKQHALNTRNENFANDWILRYNFKKSTTPSVDSYTISIPKLTITNAIVSTIDADPSKHLVQYWGTPIPPFAGNTVIFGHSTLPQLFEADNYKTIFAVAHKLIKGDEISVKLNKEVYTYRIIKTFITTADDISVLNQNTEGNYLTIVTCTPPGTTWMRLIIKARLTNTYNHPTTERL